MKLIALGLSHQTAPIELREQVAVSAERSAACLTSLLEQGSAAEAVILSTCNRTEFYCLTESPDEAALRAWICDYFSVNEQDLAAHYYLHTGQAAAEHLIRVAAGLESMILGEPQILGQVKDAFRLAEECQAVGPVLRALFEKTFSAGKHIRTTTRVGEHSVSVASILVLLAKQIFGKLEEKTILLLGAGTMIELCLQYLLQHGVTNIMVANRSLAKAQQLVTGISAEALSLAELPGQLWRADVVISSTAAPGAVVSLEMMESAIRKRRHKPVFMVDLAVPRDIEPQVGDMDDIYLYSIDDLQDVADENRERRVDAAQSAEQLVVDQGHEFMRWWHGRRAVASIRSMREAVLTGNKLLVEEAVRRLEQGQDPRSVVEHLAHALSNKLLHGPSVRLRAAAENQEFDVVTAVVRLFEDQDDGETRQ